MRRNADPNLRSRYFAFTWNNPPEDVADHLYHLWDAIGGDGGPIQYMVAGYEKAPTTGTPHVQGFFHLHPKQRWRVQQAKREIDNYLPGGMFLAPTNWTVEKNIQYCKADGDWLEWGQTDKIDPTEDKFEKAIRLAKEGSMSEVDAAMRIRHNRSLMDIAAELPEPKHSVNHNTGIWIWGPPNSGKSTVTREAVESAVGGYYLKNKTQWWDGYRGEDVVIWDEVDPAMGRRNKADLKVWADRFAFKPERKGGTLHIRPELFIAVSNWAPWQMFSGVDLQAIMKRFTVAEFDQKDFPISKERVTDLIDFTLEAESTPLDELQAKVGWIKDAPNILVYSGHPWSKTPMGETFSPQFMGKYTSTQGTGPFITGPPVVMATARTVISRVESGADGADDDLTPPPRRVPDRRKRSRGPSVPKNKPPVKPEIIVVSDTE